MAFVVVLVLPLVAELPPAVDTALTIANVVLWAAFAIDYVVRLYLAEAKWRFVRRHPLDLLLVVVPILRPLRALRLVRLLRLGIVASALHGRASRSFHATAVTYVSVTAAAMLVLAAAGMYAVEHDAAGANIITAGDALWWAAATVTTVGYGDRFPVTGEGRLVAVALMLVGIALLGVVTATIAAWFVRRLEVVTEAEERTEATLDEVLAEVRALRQRVEQLTAPAGE